jgi:class 3 adenylate cyclase
MECHYLRGIDVSYGFIITNWSGFWRNKFEKSIEKNAGLYSYNSWCVIHCFMAIPLLWRPSSLNQMPGYHYKIVSFLIADLAGYTSLTETHGDVSAMESVNKYVKLIKQCLRKDTKLIERVGDEVLILSNNIESLLQVSQDLVERVENEPKFPTIHVGLNSGKVVENEGHYYGSTLNLTSRIASYSRGGQILCSKSVVNALKDKEEYNFLKLGNVRFKNVSKLVEVFEFIRKTGVRKFSIDPVCKMQIDAQDPPAKLPYNDSVYYFCSFRCAKIFVNQPEDFI